MIKNKARMLHLFFFSLKIVKPNFPASFFFVILQLKSLLADSERSKLLRRLSEANQYNRFLKRQVFWCSLANSSVDCIFTVNSVLPTF